MTGFNYAFKGYSVVKIGNIENPVNEGWTDRFRIKIYDTNDEVIVESSYENLDPFKFSYKFNGPLLTVNDDEEIIVERGT